MPSRQDGVENRDKVYRTAVAENKTQKQKKPGTQTFKIILRDRSLFMWGGGGEKSWGGPGLFLLEKRGGPKENFTMIGGGSLCVL